MAMANSQLPVPLPTGGWGRSRSAAPFFPAARHAGRPMPSLLVMVCWVQAIYFLATGVWPLVSIGTFMAVTGPKRDVWLVRTVGVIVAVVGGVLAMAAGRGAISAEVATLAVGSAAALAAVDVFYVANRTIPKIYLLDAAAEAVLIAAWGVAWFGP